MEEGLRNYKSEEHGFQGDPLQHALEEVLDALFYIFYAMRERDSYKEALEKTMKRLQRLTGNDEES